MDNNNFCNLFEKSKIQTIAQLQSKMQITEQTVRNHLKRVGALTSYNKRGAYYTLPTTPCFNENGIWKKDGICFSTRGSLKQTFIHFISESTKGMNSSEIEEILLIPMDGVINLYRTLPEIQREKIGGRFIYFSSKEEVYSKQKESRVGFNKETTVPKSVSDEDGFFILQEKANHSSLEAKDISTELKKQGRLVTQDAVESFFVEKSLIGKSDFEHLKALSVLSKKLSFLFHSKNLLLPNTSFTFDSRNDTDVKLEGKSTRTAPPRQVHTLIGSFSANDVLTKTKNGMQGSRELQSIVAPGCNYAFDVIELIGKKRYHKHQQLLEIQVYLKEQYNLSISKNEINYLSKKFIVYLSILHEQSSCKILEKMKDNGGNILHLDAMGVKGGERLITGIDSITNFVLSNAKISSESEEKIVPFLEVIKKRYGKPLRVVLDMGIGILNAVKKVFKKPKILICHYHFLRDIGKDLLSKNYETIWSRLRHFGFLEKLRDLRKSLKSIISESECIIEDFESCITKNKKPTNKDDQFIIVMLYTLLEWILSWKNEGGGYGFPFDRPKYDLGVRLQKSWDVIENISNNSSFSNSKLEKIYFKFRDIVKEIVEDKELDSAISALKSEIIVFDKLRDAMLWCSSKQNHFCPRKRNRIISGHSVLPRNPSEQFGDFA